MSYGVVLDKKIDDILVVVMAHSDARGAVERHKKYWEACGRVVYLVPTDAELPSIEAEQWRARPRAHVGPDAILRVVDGLERASKEPHPYILFCEYDAVVLDPPKFRPINGEVMAPAFGDTREERGFEGTLYCHPPLFLNRKTAAVLVDELKKYGPGVERGFWDRAVGLAIERSQGRLRCTDLWARGACFACNPIDERNLETACEAVRTGATFIHGVKTEFTLNALEASLK
jgi:hypothetical protein